MSAYRTDSVLKLSFRAADDELLRPSRTRKALLLSMAWASPSVAIVCGMLLWHLPVAAGLLASAAVVLSIGSALWLGYRSNSKQRALQREDRREVRLQLTEDAFEIHDRTSGKRLDWDLILHWRETEQDFLIYVDPLTVHPIPKRVLTESTTKALRGMLEARIKPGGEAVLAQYANRIRVATSARVGVVVVIFGAILEALASLAVS